MSFNLKQGFNKYYPIIIYKRQTDTQTYRDTHLANSVLDAPKQNQIPAEVFPNDSEALFTTVSPSLLDNYVY